MKVNFKKLCANAVIPTKAHPTDAGFDLVATSRDFDPEKGIITYGTGIAVEIPNGYVGYLFSRSSIYKTDLIQSNAVGVIDSCYRGEVMVKFRDVMKAEVKLVKPSFLARLFGKKQQFELKYTGGREFYNVGDRIGQLIIMPRPKIEFIEVDELTTTDRGEGGYGSSGK